MSGVMGEVFIEGFGVSVGKKSERLVVKKKGEVIFERPFFEVDRVTVATEGATVSASAVHECVKNGIPIEFISYSGAPYASLVSPHLGGTVKTRRAQILAYTDGRGLFLGQAFAAGKLKSSANNLKYFAKYRKSADRSVYDYLYSRVDRIEALAKQVGEIEAGCVDEARGALLNVEGRGAAMYWEGVKKVAPEFLGREGRGATDLVNSLLNYGYGILYNRVLSAATRAGLDPFAGFVHTDRPGKPSLVLDLIEEFRAPIVDRAIVGALGTGFKVGMDDERLDEKTRKLVAERVRDRLSTMVTYRGRKQTLENIMHAQARSVASFVRDGVLYKPFVGTW
ncbi:MAG: CRISPR-associated endonuclease Cas1 [Actinomycetota bacterium]|nr:CRISPR-associated endonuclease Cas1 [Actinomycetota bacterium]